jgi:nucleotide-binding universal stress UspA family protein
MKNILVPTDFSEASTYGTELAASLAKKTRAKIHLFNAAETKSYYFSSDPLVMAPPAAVILEDVNGKLKETSLRKLEMFKKRKVFSGLDVKVNCDVTANVHSTILEYADKIKADVTIMGTKGSGNIAEILIGSTAERVVRFSRRPVIVVPLKIKNLKPRLIVFASDFKPEAYGVFPVVQSFAKVFGSEIHLLKVNTSDRFNRTSSDEELISKFNKKFGGKYKFTIYNDFMKEEGILTFSDKVKADMIAIGTHGKTGLRRFFSEDVSEGVVRLSHLPILVVNLKKK